MERRHHDRIPIDMNAVLIGEKTVPRGCKVRNLSQQGMLLKCVSDGRVSTFQEGNSVNVHLLFQQSSGCKYLTKTAEVRHADDECIGVEFYQPDNNLTKLLGPCCIDPNLNPVTASAGTFTPVSEGIDIHNATNADSMDDITDATAMPETLEPDRASEKDRGVLYAVLAFMLMAAALTMGAYLYTSSITKRISTLETMTGQQARTLDDIQEWAFPASKIEGKFNQLNTRLTALTDSFAALESRLAESSTPPPVSIVEEPELRSAVTGGKAKTEDANKSSTIRKDVKTPPATDGATAVDAAPATTPPVTTGKASGPWVINLISSPDKGAADRFAARARSKGVPVEQLNAAVNGKDYWRIQVTGFASKEAAHTYAEPIRKQLRLKDVWIYRE